MKLKRLVLKPLMWMMPFTIRHFGFVTRPVIAFYAKLEVIACGLREQDGSVRFIYTPTVNRTYHHIRKRVSRIWKEVRSDEIEKFSSDLVSQRSLTVVTNGEIYRVVAKKKKR